MTSRSIGTPLALVVLMNAMVALAALGLSPAAHGQNAPGSDPIIISAPIGFQGLPFPEPKPSDPLDRTNAIPSWLKAKIIRLEAKAYAALEGGDGVIQTGQDVVTMQTGNALQKNCTTNVASNTAIPAAGGTVTSPSGAAVGPNPAASGPAGKYGAGTALNQIAVLRGSLVTICK